MPGVAILLISRGVKVGVFNYHAIESFSFPKVAYEIDGVMTSTGTFRVGAEQNTIVSCDDVDARSASLTVASSEEKNVKLHFKGNRGTVFRFLRLPFICSSSKSSVSNLFYRLSSRNVLGKKCICARIVKIL